MVEEDGDDEFECIEESESFLIQPPIAEHDSHPCVYIPSSGGARRGLGIEEEDGDDESRQPLLSDAGAQHHDSQNPSGEISWQTLLLFRTLYFMSGISGSTWGRFSTVYYSSKGLTSSQIGLIEGVMPIAIGLVQPLWGFAADFLHRRKMIYFVTKVMNCSLLMLLAFPDIAYGFNRLFLISLGMSLFVSPGVVDGYVLETLGEQSKKMYGRLRMWTAVSWGLGSFIMGIISDTWGFDSNFLLYLGFTLVSLVLVGITIPGDQPRAVQAEQKKQAEGDAGVANGHDNEEWGIQQVDDTVTNPEVDKGKDEGGAKAASAGQLKVLMRGNVLVFFLEVLLFGMAMGVIERGLLFIYVIRDLNGTTTLCGSIVGVTVIFELPIFHYSGKILERIGHGNALLLSFLSYVGRVYGYTLLTPETIHYIFALEMVHGVTFALMWCAVVERSRQLTPKGWSTLMQSTLGAVYMMIGQGCGAVVGGWVMEKYGAIRLFQGSSALVFVLFLVRALLMTASACYRLYFKGQPRSPRREPINS